MRIVFLLLNIVFALLLLVSTLTPWVAPSASVWPSMLSYACPFFIAANMFFVIVWLCFVRKEFLLSLVVLVLRFSFVTQYVQLGGTSEYEGKEVPVLKLMTFNAHGFTGRDEKMSADTGAMGFVKILREENPDVLSLEEFFSPRHYRLLDTLKAMGYRYHYDTRSRLAGTVVFSKQPIDYVHTISGTSKMYVDIALGGRLVRFFSVHLESYRLTNDDAAELTALNYSDTSAHNLLHKLKATMLCHEKEWNDELKPALAQSPYPAVVAGDFNDTPASYIYQQMSKKLNDAFVEQGKGLITTYHGPFPAYRIDHVFCDTAISVLSYKCVHTDISDHYPVVVTLSLQK